MSQENCQDSSFVGPFGLVQLSYEGSRTLLELCEQVSNLQVSMKHLVWLDDFTGGNQSKQSTESAV